MRCYTGRDPLTGWGLLDIGSAVKALGDPLPAPDRYEANDRASTAASLWGRKGQRIKATIDYWDDRYDIYKIKIRRGQKLVARLRGPAGANSDLFLWKPGTTSIGGSAVAQRFLAAQSRSPGSLDRIRLRVQADRLVLPRREDRVARLGPVHAQVPEEASSGGAPSSSSVATSRICRAGLPTTTARAGTSRTTTAPAPT